MRTGAGHCCPLHAIGTVDIGRVVAQLALVAKEREKGSEDRGTGDLEDLAGAGVGAGAGGKKNASHMN